MTRFVCADHAEGTKSDERIQVPELTIEGSLSEIRADLTSAKMGQWRRVTRFAFTRFRDVIELEGESDSRFAWGSDKFTSSLL